MRQLPMAAILVVAGSLTIAGCSGPRGGADRSGSARYATNGTFNIGVGVDVTNWSPYQSGSEALNRLAYDSLVNTLPDGRIVSGLAERWTANARSASFTLKSGITCSDGTPLTATQVADSINWVADYKAHPNLVYGWLTPNVPFTARGNDASRTVTVSLPKKPYGFLLNSMGQLPIVCAKGLSNPKSLEKATNGTGPFTLTKVIPQQSYTFTVRQDYTWGPGGASTRAAGMPRQVVVKIVQNETTAANLLLSGELNLVQITGPEQKRLSAAGLKKIDYLMPGTDLLFNEAAGRPARDRRVREALVRALDLDQVVKVSTAGTGRSARSLRPYPFAVCSGDTVTGQLPGHDVAAAARLLDQAGWVKGSDGIRRKGGKALTLDLIYYDSTGQSLDVPTTEFVAQQWRALGVQARTPGYQASQVVDVLYKTANFDVYISTWESIYPSQLVAFLSGPFPPNGTNVPHLDNKEYNRLASAAISEPFPQSCATWEDAERALIGSLNPVPISIRNSAWFTNHAEAKMIFRGPMPTSLRVLD